MSIAAHSITFGLFLLTALAEIGGCFLAFLVLRQDRSGWLLLPAALCLGVFAWLLTFHPTAGRAYAAYGGVYVASAVAWLWWVEGQTPDRWDLLGATLTLAGAAVIAFAPRG
jgi:small multidrug resistance family-3 protein